MLSFPSPSLISIFQSSSLLSSHSSSWALKFSSWSSTLFQYFFWYNFQWSWSVFHTSLDLNFFHHWCFPWCATLLPTPTCYFYTPELYKQCWMQSLYPEKSLCDLIYSIVKKRWLQIAWLTYLSRNCRKCSTWSNVRVESWGSHAHSLVYAKIVPLSSLGAAHPLSFSSVLDTK